MEKDDRKPSGNERKPTPSVSASDDSIERAGSLAPGRREAFSSSRTGPSPSRIKSERTGSLVGGSHFAMRGMDAAYVLERQQQEQRLRNHLLMQKRQEDDALIALALAKASENMGLRGGAGNSMGLGGAQYPNVGPSAPGFASPEQQIQALLQNQQQQQTLSRLQGLLQQGGNPFGSSAGFLGQQGQLNHAAMASSSQGGARLSDVGARQMASSRDMQGAMKKPPYYNSSSGPHDVADDEEDEEDDEDDSEEDGEKKNRGPHAEPFPHKLYRMLEEAEQNDQQDIMSFFGHGRAFAIHKPRRFVTDIMPKYFSTNRMSSFQRQLNLYGFRRITEGRDKGGYFHEFFLKGRKGLTKKIKRKKTAHSKARAEQAARELANERLLSLGGMAASQLMMSPQFRQQDASRLYGGNLQQQMMMINVPSQWPGAPSGLPSHQAGLPLSAPPADGVISHAATMLAISGHSSAAAALLGREQNRPVAVANSIPGRGPMYGAGGNQDFAALQQLHTANSNRMRDPLLGAGRMNDLSSNPVTEREQMELESFLAQLRQRRQQQPPPSGPPF